jgi:hypothetical protein
MKFKEHVSWNAPGHESLPHLNAAGVRS